MHDGEAFDQLTATTTALNVSLAAAHTARTARDTAIRDAFQAGVPAHVIAGTVGLTPQRISIILGKPHQHRGRPPRSAVVAGLGEPCDRLSSECAL